MILRNKELLKFYLNYTPDITLQSCRGKQKLYEILNDCKEGNVGAIQDFLNSKSSRLYFRYDYNRISGSTNNERTTSCKFGSARNITNKSFNYREKIGIGAQSDTVATTEEKEAAIVIDELYEALFELENETPKKTDTERAIDHKNDNESSKLKHSNDSIEEIEEDSCTIYETTTEGWNLIHVAVYFSRTEIVEYLISSNAPMNIKTNDQWTPLFIAVLKGNVQLIEMILKSKTFILSLQSTKTNFTPLHLASLLAKQDVLLELLRAGFNIHQQDTFMREPLYYAYVSNTLSFPKIVWKLMIPQEVTKLNLSGCGMMSLPKDDILQSFVFLETLDISDNKLQSLSPVLSTLSRLHTVNFKNNPLVSIPIDFQSDWSSMKLYLSHQYKNYLDWKKRCCIVVGDRLVGKTALINHLVNANIQNTRSKSVLLKTSGKRIKEDNSESDSDGFSSKSGTINVNGIVANITVWEISKVLSTPPLHNILLTGQVIFIVVFNLENLVLPNIDYWLNQYKSLRANDSPILLVGTHSENPACTDNYINGVFDVLRARYPNSRYKGLYENHFFSISNLRASTFTDLKEMIVTLVLNKGPRSKLPKILSPIWMNAFNYISSQTQSSSSPSPSKESMSSTPLRQWLLPFNIQRDLKLYFNIKKNQLNELFLFMQSCGTLLYFPSPKKEEYHISILDVSWFIKMIVFLIHQNPHIRMGIIGISEFHGQYTQFLNSQKAITVESHHSLPHIPLKMLLSLLERLRIVYTIPNFIPSRGKLYFVPSNLKETKPDGLAEIWTVFPADGQTDCKRIYCFEELPEGLFHRLMSECFYIPDIDFYILWKNGVIFIVNQKTKLFILNSPTEKDFQIHITVRTPQNENSNLMRSIIEIFEDIVQTSYPHLVHMMKRLIPCVHCMMKKMLTVEPHLFSYEQCVSAVTSGQPIVFCKNIPSASRCVRIDKLAPDISFANIKQIPDSYFKVLKVIGKGGFGFVSYGLLNLNPESNNESAGENNPENNSGSGSSEITATESIAESEWNLDSYVEIAVKELNGLTGDFTEKIDSFGDFIREVYIMSYLNHPNLVNMFGICLNSPPPKLIMEYVPCGDLFQLLREKRTKNERLGERLIEKIAEDIALGMNYLHSITPPIIHRDLRSPNIFLVSLDENAKICAKVADFGLSKVTVTNKVAGTLGSWQWMAPETLDINGDDVEYNEKADVYSYGVILWEMWTGEFPFDEYLTDPRFSSVDPRGNLTFKFNEIKAAIVKDNLRPSIPSYVPPKFVDLINSCWLSDYEFRPDFKKILSLFQGDDQIHLSTDARSSVSGSLSNYEMVQCLRGMRAESVSYDNSTELEERLEEQKVPIERICFGFNCHKVLEVHNDDTETFPNTLEVVMDRVWVGCCNGIVVVYDLRLQKNMEEETRWKMQEKEIHKIIYISEKNEVWIFGNTIKIYPPLAKWEFDMKRELEQPSTKFKTPLRCAHLVVTSTSKTIWAGCPDKSTVFIWNVENYELIKTISLEKGTPVCDLLFHENIVWGASYEVILLFDPKTFELRGSFEAHPKSSVNSIIISNNSLWSAGNTGEIHLWNLKEIFNNVIANHSQLPITPVKTVKEHSSKILCLLDIDGFVWSGSFDKTIIIWDSISALPITELEMHTDAVSAIFCVHGQIWSIGFDGKIIIWKNSS